MAWLCQGYVGTCSGGVLTLSPATSKGPLACYGGLCQGHHNEMIVSFFTFVFSGSETGTVVGACVRWVGTKVHIELRI